ncbi:MAG: thiamine/thiamine pyrophosphate ABC transporter permease ThiP, partial [Rhodobacteraceae bacterium]|nr:thiamine/thiamine pyrophosphate ABC transporter permease ThiP [Paracoccaceae bacterium]
MAHSAFKIAQVSRWPAPLASALVLALTLGPLAALAVVAAGSSAGFSPADWAALRFTLSQALVSAGLSVLLAVPLARALAR